MKSVLLVLLFLLAGCNDGAKRALGLDPGAPDEFAVMTGNPLVMPPDYELKPPSVPDASVYDGKARQKAKEALTSLSEDEEGEADIEADLGGVSIESILARQKKLREKEAAMRQGASDGEKALAARLKADDGIRALIESDNAGLAVARKDFVRDLMFWRKKKEPTEVLVDPEAEADRISREQAQGSALGGGDIVISK